MGTPGAGPTTGIRRLAPSGRWLAALLLAVTTAGCAPINEGPILRKPPTGLAYTSTVQSARAPLPHRARLRQVAYLKPGGTDWTTSVIITEYSGAATRDEIQEARDEYARRYTSQGYGEVESLSIGGRDAWGWFETQRDGERVTSLGYTGVVPWGDRTFSIEVGSRDPRLHDGAFLRGVAMSFTVATQTTYDAWILMASGLILAGILWLALRAQQSGHQPRHDTVDRLLGR
ncbi:MAG: hypothetical protein MUF10_04590 [Thermoanaerobaculaceae bacterium]|nr:hypothetical protein [Thermoanaerobaculaceae bacterium]